jgi:LacI family transcriptional regulator
VALTAAARDTGLELVDRGDATAVVAHDDVTAIALLDSLARDGLRVPGDLSVVGYDGIPLAGHARVRLTTVATDVREVGRASAAMLMEALATGKMAPAPVLIPPRLVVRDTTGPPR